MKIVVAIKRALDYTARVRVKPDGSGVDLSGARMSMRVAVVCHWRLTDMVDGCLPVQWKSTPLGRREWVGQQSGLAKMRIATLKDRATTLRFGLSLILPCRCISP